jgi:hypothetical protein
MLALRQRTEHNAVVHLALASNQENMLVVAIIDEDLEQRTGILFPIPRGSSGASPDLEMKFGIGLRGRDVLGTQDRSRLRIQPEQDPPG